MRTLTLLTAAAACLVAADRSHAAGAEKTARRPNVLFLLADDQRPDTIAALGNPVIKTPNLDRLARRGFAFDNAYCMGSTRGAVCYPSRHMLLSGMSLYRYDAKKKEGTFGHLMRTAGYETFHVSKRGNTARVYHTAFEHSSYLNDGAERRSGHHGREAANRTIAFLKETWDRKRPFFAYVGFAGPHDPRVAAERWMKLYDREKISLPPNYAPFHSIDNNWMTGRDERLAPWPRTKETVRKHLHDYYGCISSIDHHIGRIVATLKELGQLENTIIIFSADHGLAIGSHGLFGKQNLYEHSAGAPLVFAGPGVKQGRAKAPAYLFDIFPTVCDLAGVKPPEGIDGLSQAPVLAGKTEQVRDTIFLSYMDGQRAVRRGDWKLIRYPQVNFTQLFNLAEDPHEQHNRAAEPEHSERVKALLELLATQQKKYGDTQSLTSEKPNKAKIDLEFFKKAGAAKKPKRKKRKQGQTRE